MLAARRRADVIRLWSEGLSREEITRRSGYSSAMVGQILIRYRTSVVLVELLGPEEGKRVFENHFEGVKSLLMEHRWSLTREQVMDWVEERETFYREHALRMADCASTLEN